MTVHTITFKREVYDNGANTDILLNGECMGYITTFKSTDYLSSTTSGDKYYVDHYQVFIHGSDKEPLFEVENFTSARSALAAAKRYAKEVLTTTETETETVDLNRQADSRFTYTLKAPKFLCEVLTFEKTLSEEQWESDDIEMWKKVDESDNLLLSIRGFGSRKITDLAKFQCGYHLFYRENQMSFSLPTSLWSLPTKVGQIWTIKFNWFWKYENDQSQTDLILELRHRTEEDAFFELRTSEGPVLNEWTGRDVWIERAEVEGLVLRN